MAEFATHEIILFDVNTGERSKVLDGHDDVVISLEFSHDGKRLISTSQVGMVIVWNIETGQEIVRYRDHQAWVISGEFSPDGSVLATSQAGRSQSPAIKLRRAVSKAEARRLLSRD